MANIRIQKLLVRSGTQIDVYFTSSLNASVGVENIVILGAGGGASDLDVISATVDSKILTINVRPMVPQAYYKLILASTSTQVVSGARGETFIEDGATNHVFFLGVAEENPIRDALLGDLPGIYNTDAGSLIYNTIDPIARAISGSSADVGEAQSANYVSITATDEQKTRGSGPTDRLSNEGAFQLLRVGATPTGTNTTDTIIYDEFPADPVSLQQVLVENEIVSNVVDDTNSFTGLLINLTNKPVIMIESIVLVRNAVEYTYNLAQYKYGIKDSKYDAANAYLAMDLLDNQIRLNDAAVPAFPFPQGNDEIRITYYYKRVGRIIDPATLSIYQLTNITREAVPAVATSFYLKHAPIIDSVGTIPVLNGITWLNPATNYNPSVKHPAFTTEIVYSQTSLPKAPGEFSVNYNNGQVFVYGVNGTGTDGTTTIPPVATYIYKHTFQSGLDYTFSTDLNEVASTPDRDLRGSAAVIELYYEDTFAEGTDFNFNSHVEIINERVEGRIIDTIGLKTLNNSVNEVFRIYNETTGELYTPTRINGNEIYFDSATPPVTKIVSREPVDFEQITQAQIIITSETTVGSLRVLTATLPDVLIMAATNDYVGANFNTSLLFSNIDVFIRELYYVPTFTLANNLTRLTSVGDYMVNYETGIIYVVASSTQTYSVGDASYRRGKIKTRNKHILRVDDVYRSSTLSAEKVKTFELGTITDTTIDVTDLELVGEYLIDGAAVLVEDNNTIVVSQDAFRLRHIYQITDLLTQETPIDFSTLAVISSANPNLITLSSAGAAVEDTNSDAGLTVILDGTRRYIEAERISALFTAGLAELVSANSIIGLTGTVNYYAEGADGYVDAATNRIYLPTTSTAPVGGLVKANYQVLLRGGAAVLVDYTPGNMFADYTYVYDELLINYEYGDNVLDWSISNALEEGKTYYATYRYGALRNALRDNFGVLTSIEELTTIPDDLDRETYRHAVAGALQSFLKGPTLPALKLLAQAITQIEPTITETVFLEWILGRDSLHLETMKLSANTDAELPTYLPGKFGNGLFLDTEGQTAILPTSSNLRLEEGTWEAFVVPYWRGIDNDANLTFDMKFDGVYDLTKIFIGPDNTNPTTIPFTINRIDDGVIGIPTGLYTETGIFIWYDLSNSKWRMRCHAPLIESRRFTGRISTDGEFSNVAAPTSVDGYLGPIYSTLNEVNDKLWSAETSITFAFTVDSNDVLTNYDGIDFTTDKVHYFFDTGATEGKNRISLYKDGQGFLRFKINDAFGYVRMLSGNIQSWEYQDVHHLAASWKIGTVEQHDEIHLFVDGQEVPNTYRFSGYLSIPAGTHFMDNATEVLISSVTNPTIGGADLVTVAGSDIVTSGSATFITSGLQVGSSFTILDETADGISTQTAPYVFVRSIPSETTLRLEVGPAGSGTPFTLVASLSHVKYSVNKLELKTAAITAVERIKVFSYDGYEDTELLSPTTTVPDYVFSVDGYQDYVNIYNGVAIDDSVLLRTYGSVVARNIQRAYIWTDRQTNILKTIMPAPVSVSKINVTNIIVPATPIELGVFGIMATVVGGHMFSVLSASLEYCQPSNTVDGRSFTILLSGNNIDYAGVNEVILMGTTTDGYGLETLSFSAPGKQHTTRYFTSLTDVFTNVTPLDISRAAGVIEIKETCPINVQENGGDYAAIYLSVFDGYGHDGYVADGTTTFTDMSMRWGEEDVGKKLIIYEPVSIAGIYDITNVNLDPSGTVMDSNTITVNTTWPDGYTNILWKTINISYADSGFANGLLTMEIANSGGLPFLLRNCWYEVDFPVYSIIPWAQMPEYLYIGSSMNGEKQSDAVIDEMRILDEMCLDTRRGETTPSSGHSITTDSLMVTEYANTNQTLALFHFDDNVINSAKFLTSFSGSYRQSENSVNIDFGQSAIFNLKQPYQIENASIFKNKSGTIEFWVSPILDTYSDPTLRYYIDIAPEQTTEAVVLSALYVLLPVRARSVSSITSTTTINYMTGGTLQDDGLVVRLGQALPANTLTVTVTYVPITNVGDRFSIYKDEVGALVYSITAAETDFQIRTPVYWKKNSWHRVVVGWNLNNADQQDRMILIVDGLECGIVRYGTGLIYGTGILYGMPTVWGSADAGSLVARNILADINFLDTFNTITVGSDFTGQYTALARMDNIRFSSELRPITYLGGTGLGQLLAKDLLYTSNLNAAQPVISDALTRLLLDFDTVQEEALYLATVRDKATGIFDFDLNVIDTFDLAGTELIQSLIHSLINRIKPAHTRGFVKFTK